MKLFILLLTFTLALVDCRLFAQAGTLDTTFGTYGIVLTEISFGSLCASAALQPDGKIIAVGSVDLPGPLSYGGVCARYNSDGSLDNTFGSTGIILESFGASNSGPLYSVAIQPDEKIVVAGNHYLNIFGIARYHVDGSPDTTFADKGTILFDTYSLNCIRIQPDGKIVAGGSSPYTATQKNFTLTRYNSDGSLDSIFGINGITTTSITSDNSGVTSEVFLPDGKIIAAGILYNSQFEGDFALTRYQSNGLLDSSFGEAGIVITPINSGNDFLISVALQPDGKIVAGGYSYNGANNDFALARYHTNGTLDSTFDNDGIAITQVGFGDDGANSIAVQSDGKILAAGFAYGNFVVVRFNSDGSLDSSFATDGIVITSFGELNESAYSVLIQSDGKIVAVGYAGNSFALARYISGLNVGIVDFSNVDLQTLIYPNPIQQNAVLEYSLKNSETISIRLLDIQGKTLTTFIENEWHEAGEHKQAIRVSSELPFGAYLIEILTADKNRLIVKIVK